MAIFFPLFTHPRGPGLPPAGGLQPRSACSERLGRPRQAGSHHVHGLRAATRPAVVATRVIDSPRERLIAIITNNFSLCNGRWPTQILIASIFVGGPGAGVASQAWPVGLGRRWASRCSVSSRLMFAVSWLLSRTVLRGEVSRLSVSSCHPYRPPRILQTIYTSIIDRTLIVLWRAVLFAHAGRRGHLADLEHPRRHGVSLAAYMRSTLQLDPAGLDGRLERRHPAGLRRGHPGQRDRHPHDPHADRAARSVCPASARGPA